MGIFSSAAAWPIALALGTSPIAVQTTIPPGEDGTAMATSRLVGGILSYSRWPSQPDPVRLCVAGTSTRAALLGDVQLASGARINLSRRAPSAVTAEQCDALFIGAMAPPDRARLISRLGTAAIVTLTDDDPACEFGAMFCLRQTAEGLSFDLNIGAVSRSRVRIDPRVLALGRRAGGRP